MTYPFENDTSAVIKKLAARSMQADKRNKAFLLLTIAISVCMVFSILLISTGTQEKFKKVGNMNESGTDFRCLKEEQARRQFKKLYYYNTEIIYHAAKYPEDVVV